MPPHELEKDIEKARDAEAKILREVNEKLYGPRYCANCDKVQPVETFKLNGSDTTRMEGTKLIVGFTGAYVCTVCHKAIGDSHDL